MQPDRGPAAARTLPASVDATASLLAAEDYVAERRLATAVLPRAQARAPAVPRRRGRASGKTEIAKVLASGLERKLVRLQCYEGLDTAAAVYEWNYPRQMIEIRLAEAAGGVERDTLAHDIFTTRFLLKRPLLEALVPHDGVAPVLLIDELDRADEPFEAYLLEVLAEYQVTIPELGAMRAAQPPIVVITSNRTREIHDAIKRRCLYHWVDYPDARTELAIVRRKCPRAAESLAREVVAFTQALRTPRPVQGAGRRGNAGLGRGAGRARPHRARSGDGRRHDRRAAQVPGRRRRDHAGGRGAPGRPRRRKACASSVDDVREQSMFAGVPKGRLAGERAAFRARACAPAGCRSVPAKLIDALAAVDAVGVTNRADFRAALGAVLVSRREHLPMFEQAFELFWRDPKLLEKIMAALLPRVHGARTPTTSRRRRWPRDSPRRCCRRGRPCDDARARDRARCRVHVLGARGAADEGLRDDDGRRAARRSSG